MAPVSRKLRESLERQLGPDEADELLNLIPPDWTQLATKHDLAESRAELKTDMAMRRSEFGGLEGQTLAGFDSLRAELRSQIRMQTYLLLGAITGLAGLVVALR